MFFKKGKKWNPSMGSIFRGRQKKKNFPLPWTEGGYPEPIAGSFVLDFKTTLGFLLLSVNSGFRTFPLIFEGINLNLFNDNGLIVSGENTESFIITDIRDFTRSPFQYIRSSIGGELEWNFIIGYEFPFVMKFGYVLALAEGGMDGYYISIKTALPF